jgi:hypothetical protein
MAPQILFQNPKIRYQQISKTDKNGDFFLYLQNGIYRVNIFVGNGYLSTNDNKTITVFNKNIVNVFFDLEKECTISGIVTFDDNTPIRDVFVHVKNARGGQQVKQIKMGSIRFQNCEPEKTHQLKLYSQALDLKKLIN